MDKFPEPKITFRRGSSASFNPGTGWLTPEEFYRLGEATTELDDMHAAQINRRLAEDERTKVFSKLGTMVSVIEIGGDQ